jgi:hypothetical protein
MPSQKYLLLQRSPTDGAAPSPARMQEMYAVWTAWKEKFKDDIVDWGAKLGRGGKVVSAAGVMDGPFVEAKEIVGGYMIITAESPEHAAEAAREMLGMMGPGASIEVREMTAS